MSRFIAFHPALFLFSWRPVLTFGSYGSKGFYECENPRISEQG